MTEKQRGALVQFSDYFQQRQNRSDDSNVETTPVLDHSDTKESTDELPLDIQALVKVSQLSLSFPEGPIKQRLYLIASTQLSTLSADDLAACIVALEASELLMRPAYCRALFDLFLRKSQ